MRKTSVRINPLLYVVWTVFIVAGQTAALLYAFLGALLHESAHICAFTLLGAKIRKIEILPFGISMSLVSATALDCRGEIIAAAAGPAANLLCALGLILLRPVPNLEGTTFFFYCNVALFVINCLPILPLDGGRIMYFGLLKMVSPVTAKKVSVGVSYALLVPLFVFALYQTVTAGNLSVLLIALYLLLYLFTYPENF